MAYQATVALRVNEKEIVTGEVSVPSGTVTVSAATFTLYDAAGAPMAGLTNVAASYIGPAASLVEVEYLLDATGLAVGNYVGIFTLNDTTSVDSLARHTRPAVIVSILPVNEIEATIDPSTVRGLVRIWARDSSVGQSLIPGTSVEVLSPVFSDAEIDVAIATVNSTVSPAGPSTALALKEILLSAAILFEWTAGDAAKVATIEKIAIFSDNTKTTYDAIKDYAEFLRMRAGMEAVGLSTSVDIQIPTYSGQTVPISSDAARTPDTRPMNRW